MITVLFLIGAALVFSFIGAMVMKRLGIPQILGFMLVGVILGLFQIFDENLWRDLYPLVDLALGLIGYSIGLEIRKEVFRGRARQMGAILILESILTFVVVTLIANWLLGQWHLAIVFGALASATDPASTVMIIWEQKTTGHLTDTLMFVLALDDVIAILLANISIIIAVLFYTAPGTIVITTALLITALDLILSVMIGGLIGIGMVYFINREDDRARLLELELGLIIMIVGIMALFEINAILACMVFGFIVANYVTEDKEPVNQTLKTIMAPIVM
ncbi:MAG: cation:proton antiporter, partial [Candidatus Thorarchaeota archaeon]